MLSMLTRGAARMHARGTARVAAPRTLRRGLRVAALQLDVSDDMADNLTRARSLVDAAADDGAKLVALPEVFTGTYGVSNFARWAEPLEGGDPATSGASMMAVAAYQRKIFVSGGIVERHAETGALYNTTATFGPDGALASVYRKVHLSRVLGITSEADVFEAGDATETFGVVGDAGPLTSTETRVGVCCCFDLRFPRFLARYGPHPDDGSGARADAHAPVDVLLAPSAFLDTTGGPHWELLLRRTALDGQCFVVAPNVAYRSGVDVPLHGRSKIVGPWGDVVAQCGAEGDDIVVADADAATVAEVRRKLPLVECGRF